ncbi:hypothetical protein ZWY2020_006990 [Hordeum vulgare]|nr:hypothetical protein ZWY2020_006990 [Hordeum vulgare]
MRAELERALSGTGCRRRPAADDDGGLVLPLVESSRSYIGFTSEKATSSPMRMVIESGGKSGSGAGGRGGEATSAMTVSRHLLSPALARAAAHQALQVDLRHRPPPPATYAPTSPAP